MTANLVCGDTALWRIILWPGFLGCTKQIQYIYKGIDLDAALLQYRAQDSRKVKKSDT